MPLAVSRVGSSLCEYRNYRQAVATATILTVDTASSVYEEERTERCMVEVM
jgi:hypothetical protein